MKAQHERRSRRGRTEAVFSDGGDIPYVSLTEYFPFLAEVAKARKDWNVVYETRAGKSGTFLISRPDNNSEMLANDEEDSLNFP